MTNAATLASARARLAPEVERARSFSGWSGFPPVRHLGPGPPWDYMTRARDLIAKAGSVLDIGTGGGERFAELCNVYGGRAVGTEEWATNAPIASARLRSRGIDLVRCADECLPFARESFDLVLDRHSALDPGDVARVLRPGGTVLTQQLQPNHWEEVRRFFPRAPDQTDLWGNHFERYQAGFMAGGLSLLRAESFRGRIAYDSLGDFVYMLCITPWTVPDFDPLEGDLEALLALERDLTTDEGLVFTEGSYILEAHKDGEG